MIKKFKNKKVCYKSESSSSEGMYWLGFFGAVFYYISTATGFWAGCFGVIKAFFWPAILIFEAMKFLGL